MRYWIGAAEVTATQASTAEHLGTARVARGGSGVVPEELRAPGEGPADYLVPWLQMEPLP